MCTYKKRCDWLNGKDLLTSLLSQCSPSFIRLSNPKTIVTSKIRKNCKNQLYQIKEEWPNYLRGHSEQSALLSFFCEKFSKLAIISPF
jgi:hypothetical protein